VLLAVGVAAVMMVVGWVVSASGAPAPGTVQTFEIRIKQSQFGANCGNKPQRACFRRPRLASVGAGNGDVYVGGRKVGTAVFANITGKTLRRGSLDLFFATIVLGAGNTLSVQGASNDAGGQLPYSVSGGTGEYAGARGTVTESEAPGGSNREFRVNVTVTFL
jgi:hypothetical protein